MNKQNFTIKNTEKSGWVYYAAIVLAVVLANLIIYAFTGNLPHLRNVYNSYALQAEAWLSGRLDLGRSYSYLEIAEYAGKFYISFPPFPSILLLPFALFFGFFGLNTPDNFIVLIMSALSAVYAFKLANIYLKNKNAAFFLSVFLCVGSNFLFLSNSGAVWFMAQVFAFSFTIMSLYYACLSEGRSKPSLSLFFLCCAMGCRPFQAVYLPLILYLIYKNRKPGQNLIGFAKKLVVWAVPAIMLGMVYMALNYARFGSIFEFGHNYLPEFIEAEHGQFSLSYFAENFKCLWRLPEIAKNSIKFQQFNGTALWLVSPIFLTYAGVLIFTAVRFARKKAGEIDKPLFFMIPSLIVLHLVLICLHRTMGGWHFGNRYTVDVLPSLLLGLAALKPEPKKLVLLNFPLMILGAGLNIVGTIFLYRGIL